MSSSLTRTLRDWLATTLVLSAAALLLSCDRSHDTLLAPQVAPMPVPAGGPSRAVLPGQNAHFYIHAFTDEWPLFMGDHVPASLATATEVVFITLSAGDGNGTLTYVQTRELALRTAVDSLSGLAGSWSCGSQVVLAHPILRCAKGLTVAYFMRLPDGSPAGDGYGSRGSMSRLRDGVITSLRAFDGSTTYTSWPDLTNTLRGIVELESGGQSAPYVELNSPDYDRVLNPDDHPDNVATADAVNATLPGRSWNQTWYVDGASQSMPQNLTLAQHDIKQKAYYAYDAVMGGAGYGYGKYDQSTQDLLWRTYYRTVTVNPGGPPAAPSALQAQPASATQIDLAWTNNTTSASSYEVERAPDSAGSAGTFALVATTSGTATTYGDVGLVAGTTYWYRVRARNSAGASGYSNTVSATTPTASLLPAAPTGLQATAASSSSISLTWTDAATNETGYTVERAPDQSGAPGTFAGIATLAAGAASYVDGALSASTRYWYRVRAFNDAGTSAYSGNASATTFAPATDPLGTPTALAAQIRSSSQIDLGWADNATSETGYTVERAPNTSSGSGTFAVIATLAANATTYSNTGLSANTTYWYRVRAFNATTVSAYSAEVSGTTPTAPVVPGSFTATAKSSSSIALAWADTPNEVSYTIDRAPDAGGTPGTFAPLVTLAANTKSYTDDGLLAATRYWYRIRSNTALESSAWSGAVSATTSDVVPAAPSGLTATAISSSRIDLAWTDNAINETAYSVERAPDNNGTPGGFGSIASLGANAVSYANTGLTQNTTYWYRVRASNAIGWSPYSNVASAHTAASATTRYDFYLHAHEDDWQLFMGNVTNRSVPVASRVVIVYASAGDNNMGSTYWHTRETAAQASMDSLLNLGGAWSCASKAIQGHNLWRCTKSVVIAYFMRLPDGGLSGEGFNNRGSMAQLRDGVRSSLTAIDNSTTYTSWSDLMGTMRGIVDFEGGNRSAPYIEVHAPEYNRTLNPGDHPDHTAVGDAMQAAAGTRSWNLNWYVDYDVQNRPINLNQAEHDVKKKLFYAYDNVMGKAGYGYNQYEANYQAWLWRTYVRRVAVP